MGEPSWKTRFKDTQRAWSHITHEIGRDAPVLLFQTAAGAGAVLGLGAVEASLLLPKATGVASVGAHEALRYALATALPSLGPSSSSQPSMSELFLRASATPTPSAAAGAGAAAAGTTAANAASKEAALSVVDPRLAMRLRRLQAGRQVLGLFTVVSVAVQLSRSVDRGRERYRALVLAGRERPLSPPSHVRLLGRLDQCPPASFPVLVLAHDKGAPASCCLEGAEGAPLLLPWYWRSDRGSIGRRDEWAKLLLPHTQRQQQQRPPGDKRAVVVVEAYAGLDGAAGQDDDKGDRKSGRQGGSSSSSSSSRRRPRAQQLEEGDDGSQLPLSVVLRAFRALPPSSSALTPIRVLLAHDAGSLAAAVSVEEAEGLATGEGVLDVAIDAQLALAQAVVSWVKGTAHARHCDQHDEQQCMQREEEEAAAAALALEQQEEEEESRKRQSKAGGGAVAWLGRGRDQAVRAVRVAVEWGDRLYQGSGAVRGLWNAWEGLGRGVRRTARRWRAEAEEEGGVAQHAGSRAVVVVSRPWWGGQPGEQQEEQQEEDGRLAQVCSSLSSAGWQVHHASSSSSGWREADLVATPLPVIVLLLASSSSSHQECSSSDSTALAMGRRLVSAGRAPESTVVVLQQHDDAVAQADASSSTPHVLSSAGVREQLFAFVRSRLHHHLSAAQPSSPPSRGLRSRADVLAAVREDLRQANLLQHHSTNSSGPSTAS